MLVIADLADAGSAFDGDAPHLAGTQPQDREGPFAGNQLYARARATGKLRALTGL